MKEKYFEVTRIAFETFLGVSVCALVAALVALAWKEVLK